MSKLLTTLESAVMAMDLQIGALTAQSWEQINTVRFDTAYQFLAEVMGVDEHGLQQMPKTQLFWKWWMAEWLRVDERYMEALRMDTKELSYYIVLPDRTQHTAHTEQRRLHFWMQAHEASPSNYYMSAELIELGYHKLIKNLVK